MVYFGLLFLLCGCCCWCMYDEHLRGVVDEIELMGSRCCCWCRVHASVVPMDDSVWVWEEVWEEVSGREWEDVSGREWEYVSGRESIIITV